MPSLQTTTAPKKETERESETHRVCFVCTGNTCRSPMAEAVANALAARELDILPDSLRELATPKLEAFSAGIFARDGDTIAENAVLALEQTEVPTVAGHDYHTHTAHTLTEQEAESFDLLIGLTREHAMSLLFQFPHLAKKITVLPKDISDPYGGSLDVYRSCLEQITEGVSALLFAGENTQ